MFTGNRRKTDGVVAGKLVATITGNRIKAVGEPHLYEITCHCSSKVWTVEHSYSEFLDLYTKLRKHLKAVSMKNEQSDSFPKMPRKHIFAASSDVEVVEERMQFLPPVRCCLTLLPHSPTPMQQVLDAAVEALLEAAIKGVELEAVRDFLQLGDAYLAALCEDTEASEPLTSSEADQLKQRQEELLAAERLQLVSYPAVLRCVGGGSEAYTDEQSRRARQSATAAPMSETSPGWFKGRSPGWMDVEEGEQQRERCKSITPIVTGLLDAGWSTLDPIASLLSHENTVQLRPSMAEQAVLRFVVAAEAPSSCLWRAKAALADACSVAASAEKADGARRHKKMALAEYGSCSDESANGSRLLFGAGSCSSSGVAMATGGQMSDTLTAHAALEPTGLPTITDWTFISATIFASLYSLASPQTHGGRLLSCYCLGIQLAGWVQGTVAMQASLGAAAAGARMVQLDPMSLWWALSTVEHRCAGASLAKACGGVGWCALTAVSTVRAAQLGCADESFVPSAVLAQPAMVAQVSAGWLPMRMFPRPVVCYHRAAQVAVHLTRELMLQHSVMFGDVVRAIVQAPVDESAAAQPTSTRAAERSVRWAVATALLSFPRHLSPEHVCSKVLSDVRMSSSWDLIKMKHGGGELVSVTLQLLDGSAVEQKMTVAQWQDKAEVGEEPEEHRRSRCVSTAAVGVGTVRAEEMWESIAELQHTSAAQWLEVMSRPLDQAPSVLVMVQGLEHALAAKPPRDQLDALFDLIDANGDGMIDRTEWVKHRKLQTQDSATPGLLGMWPRTWH